MSDTPLTDAIISAIDMDAAFQDLCRQLEQELSASKAEVERLKKMVIEAAELGDKRSEHFKARAEKAEALVKQIHHYAGIIEGFQNPATK
jgi:membrane protein involved in colicin uptake